MWIKRASLFVLLFAAGCGSECKLTSQCAAGQYCDFNSGTCIQGCTGPEDCSALAVCQLETGRCRNVSGLIDMGPRPTDAGMTDTGTVTDGGMTDTGTISDGG